jgi:hypothetical protein
MQRDGEGSARDPCCTAQPVRKYGASAQVLWASESRTARRRLYCLRMRLSVKRVLQTRRPVRGGTYRLIPPAVFDGSRRARQRLRSQRFNRNVYSI